MLAWGGLFIYGGGTRQLYAGAALEMWTAGLLGFGLVAFLSRRQILSNAATRSLAAFLTIALVTPFATTLVALQFDAPMYQRSVYSWVAMAGIAALGEVMIIPAIWPAVLVYIAGIVAVLLDPSSTFVIQPLVIIGNAGILVRALRRHAERSRVLAAS